MTHNCVYTKNNFYVNTVAFHKRRDILLSGNIAGELQLYSWDNPELTLISTINNVHSKSVRRADISQSGADIISVSADKRAALTDIEKGSLKWRSRKHDAGVSAFCQVDDNIIATGDDDGVIMLWDTRVTKAACKDKCTEFTSSIEGIMLGRDPHDLLAISDDQLACFSMKKSAKILLRSMSDNVEDEFVSLCFMKNQKKVVCGSNTGNICLFSYGHWGDINDRLTVGVHSLDSILPYNDDVLLVGGDDKSIRVATILPNEVKGKMKCIGKMDIDVLSTDSLCLNMESTALAFIANYEYICVVPTDEVERLLDGDTEESNFFDDLE